MHTLVNKTNRVRCCPREEPQFGETGTGIRNWDGAWSRSYLFACS